MEGTRSPQEVALEALGDVLVGHLRGLASGARRNTRASWPASSRRHRTRPGEAPPPIVFGLDGPGADDLLDQIAPKLRSTSADPDDERWTVIHFDAWQFQRVQPPWWWLVEAFDRQIRADLRERGWPSSMRHRLRTLAWSFRRIAADPWVLGLVVVAVTGVVFLSVRDMRHLLATTAGLTGWLTTIAALLLAVINRFRRNVLLFSPRNEEAILRARDPMAVFQERYAFLLRARSAPVAFLVENLDRCRARYVVELLEGIQTLLKRRPATRPTTRQRLSAALERHPSVREVARRLHLWRPRARTTFTESPPVAFLVAADEQWLCESFVEVYGDLCGSGSHHGRSCGLAFLDKVFDHSLHLPTVPVMAAVTDAGEQRCSTATSKLSDATQEIAIRELVHDTEVAVSEGNGEPPPSLQRVRVDAVKRLGEIEDLLDERLCSDTTWQLSELATHLDAAAEVWGQGQLRTAYCSQRTAQLLGGHEIDHDPYSICRLGLWTVLALKWPLLAGYLVAEPDAVTCLRAGRPPRDCPENLIAAFADPRARQIAIGFPGQADLTPVEVRRFSVPAPRPMTRFRARAPHEPSPSVDAISLARPDNEPAQVP